MLINDPADPVIPAIIDRMREYQRAYDFGTEAFDINRVAHLYRRDEALMAYDVAPPLEGYVGWNEYTQFFSKALGKFSEFHYTISEDEIRAVRVGDVAWVTVPGYTSGTSAAGEPFHKDLRLSLVLVREGDDWLIAHEHCSAPRLFELNAGSKV